MDRRPSTPAPTDHGLSCMSGPPIEMHIKDNVTPKAVHKAAPVPVHWQEQVLADLRRDEKLGVIEKVPYGEPVVWYGMVIFYLT